LRILVEQIHSLNKSIAELEKTIAEEASKLEGHKNLISIKGIGKVTSAVLLSVIGDVDDFQDERRGAGKAIVALARKFLGIVYRTLKNNWVFEDFSHFVLAEPGEVA